MNEATLMSLDARWIPDTRMSKVGVSFLCPACDDHHRIRVRWEGPADETLWQKAGYTFDDLTLTPSIDGTPLCKFHGYVTNGMVTWP